MTPRLFIPADAAAVSVGADDVAVEFEQRLGTAATIVRNGSRGLFWLEPMVEIETLGGRIAYGPVAPADVAGLLDAGMLSGGAHRLLLGPTEAIPFLKGRPG